MEKLDVQIVQLPPMRVASALGYGPSPEALAWATLLKWSREAGLDLAAQRFFGFNNPDPAPGSPNYGYEQWVTMGPQAQPGGAVALKDFSGGWYAMAACLGPQTIPQTWKALLVWLETSSYRMGAQQCLEEAFVSEWLGQAEMPWEKVPFKLYLSVAK